MDIIFNSEADGGIEVKEILGFIDADFTFKNLITDIELQTPYLIDYIGKETYELALYIYDDGLKPSTYTIPVLSAVQEEQMKRIIKLIQTYILIMANHQYEQSNDLLHTNSGRKVNRTEHQVTPWEWQINKDNAAQMKKAYQALDQLISILDESEITTWLESDAYKKSKSLFIYNTRIFDDIYPINMSGQLYYRLVPFMEDIEIEKVYPILQKEKWESIKNGIASQETLTDLNEIRLLKLIRNAVAYFTLEKAYNVFPIEMFPDKINYQENTTMRSRARAEVMLKLRKDAEQYLLDLEKHYGKMTSTRVERDPMQGLSTENNHVSL
ncbi:DUF6712 family protein [Aquimarina sp. AU58]|uniref:DUF6712 family protein n=1 Tax=Aquimarina sp. AU58 TaxID=1874112 RepID=UPI000D6E7495|nr:DUF6712 family protein [Aquimarina sp. AU58]